MIAPAWLLLLAPPSPAPPPRFEETVVVTADRAPREREELAASVDVLGRADVEALPAGSAAELLAPVAGIQVRLAAQPGPLPMSTARGFFGGGEAEYVQLRVDGAPLLEVESGVADWHAVRAESVERIEVLRGPGSPLYGDATLAGVVQVFTRAAAAPRGGEVLATAGPFGSASAQAGIRRLPGRWRWALEGAAEDGRGFRERSSLRQGTLSALASRDVAGGPLRLVAAWEDRERHDPGVLPLDAPDPSVSHEAFRLDGEDADRRRASLSWERAAPDGRVAASLQGLARGSTGVRTLLLAAGLPDRAHRRLEASAWGATIDVERGFRVFARPARAHVALDAGRDTVEVGYRAVADDGTAGAPLSAAAAQRRRAAVLVAADSWVHERVRVALGLRGDAIDDGGETQRAWSPQASVRARLTQGTAVFVRAAHAFKAPTLDQLFDPRPFPDFAGGSFTVSNPALSPQRARSLEAGLARYGRPLSGQATVYAMEVEDEIDFDPATFRYTNIGRSVHRGLELSLEGPRAARVVPRLAYTLTEVRAVKGAGQLKNVPRHVVQAAVRAQAPLGISADLAATWTSRRYLDDANTVALGSYWDVSGRLRRTFGRVEARLDLLNLLDSRYDEVGYVLPDLAGGVAAFALPGSPRGLRFGVRAAF
jgi:outer membrane cobalamin receptor